MRVQVARDNFVRGAGDEIAALGVELTEIPIDEGGRFFENRHRAYDLARHDVARRGAVADVEIDERPRGLRSVVAVDGNLNGSHRVGFGACERCRRRK